MSFSVFFFISGKLDSEQSHPFGEIRLVNNNNSNNDNKYK